jgi:5-methylcytosine-specific restriction endonuclease McrA
MNMQEVFLMPKPMKISGRSSTITAAFVTAIIPQIKPTEDEIHKALKILKIKPENMQCAYCGGTYSEWDHLRPLVLNKKPTGYFSHIQNLVPSCGKCNQSKGGANRHWKEWMLGTATFSPNTRGIKDLKKRIKRLTAYESWGNVGPINFAEFVSKDDWNRHWDNCKSLHEDMKNAQEHAVKVQQALQQGLKKYSTKVVKK